ncbi:MAG: endonuclease/exonuclease/phosphatase family protein, partial [Pseudomonadota bacterium]|nr:endonuclease/exonuclease/phosphatase family protein [Pseudomonadota bacterium]
VRTGCSAVAYRPQADKIQAAMSNPRLSLSIGTFNLYNLIDESREGRSHYVFQPTPHNRYEPEEFANKTDWIADRLKDMNADIVAFQEVYHKEALDAALAKSGLYGGRGAAMAEIPQPVADPDENGNMVFHKPSVALATRPGFEIVSSEPIYDFPDLDFTDKLIARPSVRDVKINVAFRDDRHADFKPFDRFYRPILKARVRLPPHFRLHGIQAPAEVTIFVVHFKSKGAIKREVKNGADERERIAIRLAEESLGMAKAAIVRTMESLAVRFLVIEELRANPGIPIIVMGDLNDGVRSVSTDIATGVALPLWLPKRDAARGVDYSLFSTYELQTKHSDRDVYYTHLFRGVHETLDHIFVSKHFVPQYIAHGTIRQVGAVANLRVLNDFLVDEEIDGLTRAEVKQHLKTRSDHAQLVTRIDWLL